MCLCSTWLYDVISHYLRYSGMSKYIVNRGIQGYVLIRQSLEDEQVQLVYWWKYLSDERTVWTLFIIYLYKLDMKVIKTQIAKFMGPT